MQSSLKGNLTLLFLVILCLLACCGCGTLNQSGSPDVLRIGISTSIDDARGQGALAFAEEVMEKTDNRITVTVTQDEELTGEIGLVNNLASGKSKYDIIITGASNFSGFAPTMSISAMPYLFDDYDTAWAFMDSEIEAEIEEALIPHNIRILSHYCSGFRCLTNSVRPVNEPKDLNGLVIRTPDLDLFLSTMSAMGADARPLSFSELNSSLKKNAYDGQENPIPLIYNNKLYETQKYLTVSNHIYSGLCFAISESVWQRLSSEDQAIIQNAADNSAAYERQLNISNTEEYLEFFREQGIEISEPDLTPFKEATRPVIDKKSSRYGEYWDRTLEWLATVNRHSH